MFDKGQTEAGSTLRAAVADVDPVNRSVSRRCSGATRAEIAHHDAIACPPEAAEFSETITLPPEAPYFSAFDQVRTAAAAPRDRWRSRPASPADRSDHHLPFARRSSPSAT
jgi:hypothetical protein